jgi:hypothetical protein
VSYIFGSGKEFYEYVRIGIFLERRVLSLKIGNGSSER